MKIQRLFLGAFITLGLVLSTGCTEAGTSTAGTALYALDTTGPKILAWDDMETLYSKGSTSSVTTAPTPDRTMTSPDYLSGFSSLGLGGMCMDRSRNRLWLVTTSGLVARIDSIRSRPAGAVLNDTYVRTFQLGTDSNDRLANSTFGQMAVDVSTGALCITEWSSSDDSRIWVIGAPTNYAQGDKVASSSATLVKTSGDTYGYGVAVGSSSRLFGYFNNGDTIEDANTKTYTGARLRMGTVTGGFPSTSVIVGTSTELSGQGTLAADTANSLIYVAPNSSGSVIAFQTSKFTTGYNVAPSITLPNAATAVSLNVIAHAGNKNWLVGTSDSSSALLLWKSPSKDTTTLPIAFSYGSTIRGLALDGSASSD